jgi:uncharacterized integral membrane protein (TIGR00698 family)
MNQTNLFFVGIILVATGILSPPLALLAGLIFGLAFTHPYPADTKRLSTFLLQASVVGLGFGMNLHQVVKAGRSGFVYTLLSISFALVLGLLLGKMFRVNHTASLLIATGTAICGGSAIAAVGPVVHASEEEMAVSLGTVFTLNSIALLLFPAIGLALHLSQSQFGLWAALAIHDTSSVVGASAKYGDAALLIGTTVKLARALWIVPLVLVLAVVRSGHARIRWPWFIGGFCLAAAAATYVPALHDLCVRLSALGKAGLTVTLFLIGSGISKETLRRVGYRPFLQGIALWAVVAVGSLLLIRIGWISI